MLRSQVNPFATRYVQPGMVAWFAAGTQSLATLERRFTDELGCRAAIVGPHGSGKSTLLEHLVPRLGRVRYREAAALPHEVPIVPTVSRPTFSNAAARGQFSPCTQDLPSKCPQTPRSITWLALRRGAQAAQRVALSRQHWQPGSLLVLDGFEQLSGWTQWRTIHATRRRRMGLLVTSHARLALNKLVQTETSLALVQHVIDRAQENAGVTSPPELSSPPLIAQLLQEEGGNVREVLMRLYDRVHAGLPK